MPIQPQPHWIQEPATQEETSFQLRPLPVMLEQETDPPSKLFCPPLSLLTGPNHRHAGQYRLIVTVERIQEGSKLALKTPDSCSVPTQYGVMHLHGLLADLFSPLGALCGKEFSINYSFILGDIVFSSSDEAQY